MNYYATFRFGDFDKSPQPSIEDIVLKMISTPRDWGIYEEEVGEFLKKLADTTSLTAQKSHIERRLSNTMLLLEIAERLKLYDVVGAGCFALNDPIKAWLAGEALRRKLKFILYQIEYVNPTAAICHLQIVKGDMVSLAK
jgi:hypothetical protein